MKRKVSRREFMKTAATAGIMFSAGTLLLGQGNVALAKDMQPIRLPQPQSADGNAFLKLLEKRQSIREYGPEPVPAAVLAGLLRTANARRPLRGTTRRSTSTLRPLTASICTMQKRAC